jgi:hypothetical protein
MGVSFGVLIAMMCSVSLARTFPHNYILLGIFTLAESIMVGTICMVCPFCLLLLFRHMFMWHAIGFRKHNSDMHAIGSHCIGTFREVLWCFRHRAALR